MGTSVLTNGLMTWVGADYPTTNFDASIASQVRKASGTPGERRSLLYFARPFPLGATITNAKLVLYSGPTAQTGTLSIDVKRILSPVNFTKATWNTRPTTYHPGTATASKTGPLAVDGTLWDVDVTAGMQSVSLGQVWYGFEISSTTLNPYLNFFAPNHPNFANRPRLEVTWSDAPAKPTGLAPGGGRAISGTKPIVRCTYVDVSGDTEMQSIQVQANATNVWTAPTFDSGTVASSTPELDLNGTFPRTQSVTTTNASATVTGVAGTFLASDVGATITGTGIPGGATITVFGSSTSVTISANATASATVTATITESFPAMTNGQVVFWRARVQDMAGLWSEWSDAETFTRDDKGTLTLTNPPSGTPVVEEATPPISWTFTGETQSSYQLFIQETTAGGQVKQWTTGKKTAATTTVTLPAGVINSPDSTYQATIRVWDAKQRETIPNDPAYAEVVRAFTFVPTASVTATTSPTATLTPPYPRVAVGWQRATAPDSFTILRNRQVIASGLIPATYLVSGTTYSFTDRGAPPKTTLTYEVQAIVNGRASASNPTVVTTMTSQGIWLADTDRTNEVMIVGKADRDFTYGEASEPVEVVGGTEIVLVTQSLRGLEGRITGELHSGIPGVATTAQQWRDKMLNIKAKPGQKCWLTFGDRTMQVVIRNVSIAPRSNAQLSFSVGFDFYQVGTLEFTPSL